MVNFEKLNIINGFDNRNLRNAKQNNYAWSMAEFGDYIYVGTGRNIAAMAAQAIPSYIELLDKKDESTEVNQSATINIPLLIRSNLTDNSAEIWRYKKDGSLPWKRVLNTTKADNISGFRFMITHRAQNSTEALYAASFVLGDSGMVILKSTDGSNWTKVSNDLEGSSSRAMVSFNGKLYVSSISNSAFAGESPLLYSSEDPEFCPFKSVIDATAEGYKKECNPSSGIADMAVFNNRLYVTTSGEEGMEVWRTNSDCVKMNDWTLVVDKGFGDAMNSTSISMGVFKNHLYVAAVRKFPLCLIIPMGSELIRLDKNDKWELVVGGKALNPTNPTIGTRTESLSGYTAGFSNPLNLYIWQLKSYDDMLLATTFDHGSNIEVLRDIALLNKDLLVANLGQFIYEIIIKIYDGILYLFNKYNYPRGFDLFASTDGANFELVNNNGFGNGNNYGGRILMPSVDGDLYIGTANPYDGCEVLKTSRDQLFINCLGENSVDAHSNMLRFQDEVNQLIDLLLSELKKAGKMNL